MSSYQALELNKYIYFDARILQKGLLYCRLELIVQGLDCGILHLGILIF